ncbi:MAG: TFIIB-type zinc ribbon-containing protein [Planctomycetota bacterium]
MGFSPRDVAKLKVLLEYKVNRSIKPTTHPCPKCGKNLKARNYANIAGFFIEQCGSGCGVWVREGDLDRIRILRSLGRFEKVRTAKAKKAPAPGKEPEKPVKEKGERKSEHARPPAKKRPPMARARPREVDEGTTAPRRGFLSRIFARLFGGRK